MPQAATSSYTMGWSRQDGRCQQSDERPLKLPDLNRIQTGLLRRPLRDETYEISRKGLGLRTRIGREHCRHTRLLTHAVRTRLKSLSVNESGLA